jgi:hypothetical protein
MSTMLDTTNLTPHVISRFLLDLLRYNDNSRNKFSDANYLACLLSCIGNFRLGKDESSEPCNTIS